MENNTTKFNSKATYLAYITQWKVDYKQLSITLRLLKLVARESSRAHYRARVELDVISEDAYYGKWKEVHTLSSQYLNESKAYHESLKLYPKGANFFDVKRLKERATTMLKERKESKLEAQRQYLAAKTNLASA
jgi:hypothetical protein